MAELLGVRKHLSALSFHSMIHKSFIIPLIKFVICNLFNSYKDQREHFALEMDTMSIEYPIGMIRGPVPWKCNFQIATNRLDQVLMVNHPVLQAINYLWYQL